MSGDGWCHARHQRHQPKFEHRYSVSKLSIDSKGALIPLVYLLNALSVYMASGFQKAIFGLKAPGSMAESSASHLSDYGGRGISTPIQTKPSDPQPASTAAVSSCAAASCGAWYETANLRDETRRAHKNKIFTMGIMQCAKCTRAIVHGKLVS